MTDPFSALRNFPPFATLYVDADTAEVREWFWVSGQVFARLSMGTTEQRAQLRAMVASEIAAWTRALASTRRAWQSADRRFREWKAAQYLAAKKTPVEGKTPSDSVVEAGYRTRPEYQTLSVAVERAEEATTALEGIVKAFEAAGRILGVPASEQR